MNKEPGGTSWGPPMGAETGCCRIEAVVSVDERGQMVLPKEVRDRAGVRAGDKLALITFEQDGRVCCISLIKVEDLAGMVKATIGPVMAGILQG